MRLFLTFSPSFSAFLQLLAFRAELYVPDATVLETEKGEGKREGGVGRGKEKKGKDKF